MKYSLPILSSGLVSALAVGVALWMRGGVGVALLAGPPDPQADSAAASDAGAARDASGRPTDGQALVATAARTMHESPPLDARLVVQINLLSQSMNGPGTYLHLGSGGGMSRLDMKLGVEGRVTSFQQVCDGRFLWTRRQASDKKSLVRIDLRRIEQALDEAPNVGADPDELFFFGGLPQLLASLNRCFQFGAPRAGQLDEIPVWVLHGTWKPERLEAMARSGASEEDASGKNQRVAASSNGETASDVATSILAMLPPHVPHEVVLTLGRDETFPLFPYRVEFRKAAAAKTADGGAGEARATESVVTIEFFAVRRRDDLDPLHFRYEPGDQEVEDRTAELLERLGLPAPPP